MDIYEIFKLHFAIQFMIWFFIAIKEYKEQLRREWCAKQVIDKSVMQFYKDVITIVAKLYKD